MAGIRVEAPAKINLHLRIGQKRPDGYHELESLFVPLAFGDTLDAELLDGQGPPIIRMEGISGAGRIRPEENILFKTVSLFREKTAFGRKLNIGVLKRIPLGGGLGGGSSDAAALLAVLNRLSGADLSGEELREIAEKLGSDVPFFLFGGAALAGGRGEKLLPVDFPGGMSVVLVNPGFSSSTAGAYSRLDAYRQKKGISAAKIALPAKIAGILKENPRNWPFVNDFLPVFQDTDGENREGMIYGKILSALSEAGADFSGLSGSGSTCFGIFTDGGKAEQAAKILSNVWTFVQLTFFLARKPDTVVQ
jgi:4-diphosphocytidyl-2-C-methyl-D-erythritol kinase